MKLRAILIVLLALTACATPVIRLSPVYAQGERRVYALEATVDSVANFGGEQRTERAELNGTSTIEVRSLSGEETTLTVTLTLDSFLRNGKAQEFSTQQAEVVVGPNGAVRRVTEIGGLPPELLGTNVEQFSRLLAVPLPGKVVELGDRWRTTLPDGVQSGRIRALRAERGFDCAIASTTTQRRVERDGGESGVALTGNEVASGEIAFAFGEGFPVLIRNDSEADMDVTSPSIGSGTLRITSHATLSLTSRSA